jgi:hypothetical protein
LTVYENDRGLVLGEWQRYDVNGQDGDASQVDNVVIATPAVAHQRANSGPQGLPATAQNSRCRVDR